MNLIDKIRAVPETAVRLYLGARATQADDGVTLDLDGRKTTVEQDVYDDAVNVCRALKVKDRTVEHASDVLELRHSAEDIYLEELVTAKGPKILVVPSGDNASSFYRARIPSEVLSENGMIVQFTDRLDLAKALRYDCLWVQLVASPMMVEIVKAAKAAGIKIVYDFDDRFDAVHPNNPASDIYVKEKQQYFWKMIELADLVTVSTQALAEAASRKSRNVKVVPNHVLASILPERAQPRADLFRILWAGSPSHRDDLAIVAPALLSVLQGGNGKIRFTCFGERLPDALVPVRDYCDVVPFTGFDCFPDTLAAVGADLAIAPLAKTDFNDAKSGVKILEYSAAGYPSLASPVGEYPELAKLGLPVRIVPDGAWKDALEFAISCKGGTLDDCGKAAMKWVRENRCIIRSKATAWREALDQVFEKAGV